MSSRRRVRGLVALSALLLGASVLSACDNGDDIQGGGSADDTTGASSGPSAGSGSSSGASDGASGSADATPAGMGTNVKHKTDVPVSTELKVFRSTGGSAPSPSAAPAASAPSTAPSPATAASGRPTTCSSRARRTPCRRASRVTTATW